MHFTKMKVAYFLKNIYATVRENRSIKLNSHLTDPFNLYFHVFLELHDHCKMVFVIISQKKPFLEKIHNSQKLWDADDILKDFPSSPIDPPNSLLLSPILLRPIRSHSTQNNFYGPPSECDEENRLSRQKMVLSHQLLRAFATSKGMLSVW